MADDAIADIDDIRGELAVVVPTEFTATRNERAKALRAAKERERAALVAKLPKPTWTAWALNVLARRDPDVIAGWLQAGDALDAALGAGDRDALRAAQQDERAVLADTIERAHAVLTEVGRSADDQTAQKLTGTLRAAITDAGVRDRLVRGVLDDDVEAPAFGFGFGAAASSDVVSLDAARAKRSAGRAPSGATRAGSRPSASSGRRGKAAGPAAADAPVETDDAEARAREDAEARAREEAEARAREEAEAERLAAERTRLADELRSLEADLDARTQEADAAEAALQDATAAAEAASRALDDARAAVAAAQAALDELGDG